MNSNLDFAILPHSPFHLADSTLDFGKGEIRRSLQKEENRLYIFQRRPLDPLPGKGEQRTLHGRFKSLVEPVRTLGTAISEMRHRPGTAR